MMTDERPLVLVVDDDPEILAEYLRSLKSEEYRLQGVQRLSQALHALDTRPVDVVVTDLQLEDADDGGMQVLQKARSVDATVAVIMVTAVGRKAEAERAILELGAHAFLRKPLDFAACRKLILEAILARRKRLASIDAADRGEFALIQNPYVPGKPLRSGSQLFYGRDDVFDFIRDNLCTTPHPAPLAIFGPRRIGKTSLLKQLRVRLEDCVAPVYVDCQSFGMDPGMAAFFSRLGEQIRRGLEALGWVNISSLPSTDAAVMGDAPAMYFLETFMAAVYAALDERLLVLCLDEFEALEEKVRRGRLDAGALDFFGQLISGEEQIVCILCGTRDFDALAPSGWAEAGLLEDFRAFQLGALPETLARRLIEEPPAVYGVRYTPQAVQALLDATGCHPYLLQLLCAELIKIRNEARRNELTYHDVHEALARVVDERRGDFFWATLSPYHQAALIAACQAAHDASPACGYFTAAQVEQRLTGLGFNAGGWPQTPAALLRDLAFQQLLREDLDEAATRRYRLAFQMLGDWVRRNKSVDQVLEAMVGAGKPV